MDDWTKILLSSFTALIVLLIGQALIRFILEPIQEYWKLRAEIVHNLIFYKNVVRMDEGSISSAEHLDAVKAHCDEASLSFRRLAARLSVQLGGIPLAPLWSWLSWLPSPGDANKAHRALIALSNSQHSVNDDDVRERARAELIKALQIRSVGV